MQLLGQLLKGGGGGGGQTSITTYIGRIVHLYMLVLVD